MQLTTLVSAFVRMMQDKLALQGAEPTETQTANWAHLLEQAARYPTVPTLDFMLSAWNLQAGREREEFHVTQESMLRQWHQAIELGEAYLEEGAHTARLNAELQTPVLPGAELDGAEPAAAPSAAPGAKTPSSDKAVKRRFGAYLKAFQSVGADASHAQWLTALARSEGFANFQALRAKLQADRPSFCPLCGSAGTVAKSGSAMSCSSCGSAFNFSPASSAPEDEGLSKLKQDTLEELGYDVRFKGNVKSQRFVWETPSSESENAFATDIQAWADAWEDAAQQTRAIAELDEGSWNALTLQEQSRLMQETLAEV